MLTAARRLAAHIILLGYGIFAVTVFAVVALASVVVVALLPRLDWRRGAARQAARLIFALAGIPLRVRVLAPLPDTPCVVVANHASYIDGIVLCAVLPPRFTFVIKREVTRAPLAHFLLRRIGAHFVERHDRQRGAIDARALLRAARDGQSIAVFPEGTFVREPGLRRFRSGAFAAAVAGGLPVVPLIIEGSRHILPAQSYLPRRGPLALTVFGALHGDSGERAEVARLAHAARVTMLAELDEPDALAGDASSPPAAERSDGRRSS